MELRVVAILFGLAACKSAPHEPAQVVVSRTDSSAAPSAAPNVASNTMAEEISGWVIEGDTLAPEYRGRGEVVAALRAAPARVVASFEEKIEECSSAGGSHVLFKSDDGKRFRLGGHGANLQAMGAKPGDVFVLGIAPKSPPQNIENKGWCVPAHVIDGEVRAALPAADLAAGRQLLGELAK